MEHISQDSALRSLAAQSASWDGTPLNIARIARRFGVSRPTATSRVRELEARGLVRLLPFYGAQRRPLFCVCDGSFRSLCMDEVIAQVRKYLPEARFYETRTGYPSP
jgi:hypothetical protein